MNFVHKDVTISNYYYLQLVQCLFYILDLLVSKENNSSLTVTMEIFLHFYGIIAGLSLVHYDCCFSFGGDPDIWHAVLLLMLEER